ncbi:hypothetical protein [Methylocella sp.]|uniref:hypothetical protein n=1 Tax=Methylocella sp. TaxID=1978226 RepID=UPI003784D726
MRLTVGGVGGAKFGVNSFKANVTQDLVPVERRIRKVIFRASQATRKLGVLAAKEINIMAATRLHGKTLREKRSACTYTNYAPSRLK